MSDIIGKRHLHFAALAVALGGLCLAGCSREAPKASDSAPPLTVSTARLSTANLVGASEAGGIVQARATAVIAARILAPVREVRAVPGDRVRAGQVLIVLDAETLGAQARGARAAAAASDQGAAAAVAEQQAADATLSLARATRERIAGLYVKRSATAQEFDAAESALRTAEAHSAGAAARTREAAAAVESAHGSSEAASATASFAQVTAPFAGIVVEKMVEPGNMAAPGTPLLRLEDTGAFRLEVRMDESRLGRLSPGDTVPVFLDMPSGTRLVNGTVSEIARAVDADTRAFLVKIALPETAGLRSGTFGRARFPGSARRTLQLPDAAVVRRGQVTSVFVVENGIARSRLVSLRGAEVLAGLSDGEVVVVAPPPTLTDGRRVTTGTK